MTQEFSNENLSIVLTREPGCRVKLDVTITPDAAEAAYRKAVKVVNKEVSLPGFRKGKAPENLIMQNYAKPIDQEWRELMVQTTFREALTLTNVYPFNDKSVDRPQLKQCSRQEGGHIIFTMETFPEIPAVDPSNITLTEPKRKEVRPEDVENAIMDLRLNRAAWNEITDRSIQDGDYVNVDIDNLDDPENPVCQDTHLFMKKGKIGKWIYDLIIGKKAGDAIEGTSEKEEELSEEFVETRCLIKINKIESPELPELDDEFAAKFGLKTIQELYQKVEEDLNKQATERVQEILRMQVEDALFNQYAFDVPSTLFEGEKKSRLQYLHSLKGKLTPENYKKAATHYQDEKLNTEVLRSLCLYFLKRKIAEDNNVEVNQNEIMQEMLWHLYNPSSRLIDPSMNEEQIRSKIFLHLLNRKTNDFLVNKANLVRI